jgi:hypothetical protein
MGNIICGSEYRAFHSAAGVSGDVALTVCELWRNKDALTDGSNSDFTKARSMLKPVRLTAAPFPLGAKDTQKFSARAYERIFTVSTIITSIQLRH